MPVTTAQQTQLIGLTTLMFNAPPGADYLAQFAAQLEAGQSLVEIAAGLSATTAFNAQFESLEDDAARIDLVLGFVGIDEDSPAYQEAFNYFEQSLRHGRALGEVFVETSQFLLATQEGAFQEASATFRNKVEVGFHYSASLGLSSSRVEELQAAIAGVTADSDTVLAARQALDAMPVAALGFGEPVNAFDLQDPDGRAMGWIWSDTIRVRGFEQDVMMVHGALEGQGNLMNITPTPLLFFAPRDGRLVDVTAELNPDRVSTVITRDIHVADFTGDGWDDIFLSNHGTERYDPFPGEQNSLMLQGADGAFRDATDRLPARTDFSHGSSVGDFNNDGHLDIYINNLGDDDLTPSYFLFNDGQGGFNEPVDLNNAVQAQFDALGFGSGVLSLTVDIGNTGRDDVFLGKLPYFGGGEAHGYLRNDGDTFTLVLDENFVWPGTGNGIFTYKGLDYNGDGLEDILIFANEDDILGNPEQTLGGRLVIHAYENRGEEGFRFATEGVVDLSNIEDLLIQGGLDVQVVDITGNGLPDFEVRAWDDEWQHIRLTFVNDGEGGFLAPILNHDGIAIPRGHYLNVNDDGIIDLVYPGNQVQVRYGEFRDIDGASDEILLSGLAHATVDNIL